MSPTVQVAGDLRVNLHVLHAHSVSVHQPVHGQHLAHIKLGCTLVR